MKKTTPYHLKQTLKLSWKFWAKPVNVRIKNYYFSTDVLPILAVLGLFALLIRLGVWQIHRGDEKKRIQIEFSQQRSTTPIHLNQIHHILLKNNYFPVIAEGKFDNNHNFLLDNKIVHHQIGYEVLTPFILKNNGSIILVNRGWIPQGNSRKILPIIKKISETTTIKGLLIWPRKTFSLKTITEKNWPQRIQTLTPEFLTQNQFTPFIILINQPHSYGFVPPQPITLHASQHYAYAFQWFALSLTLLIAFFASHLSRHED